jgi:hypothetical protein
MKYIIKLNLYILFLLSLSSCTKNPLEGTWQYNGGVYNGRQQKASPEFKLQRTYSANSYEAYKIEGTSNQELYNSGVYEIHADTLSIISKFSSRPSQNTDLVINYTFKIKGNKLTINGIMPNGMIVEEYWNKKN